jgi:HEAT repeat protein
MRFSPRACMFALLGLSTVFPVSAGQPTQSEILQTKAWGILWDGAHADDTAKRSKAIHALGLLYPYPEVVQLTEGALKDPQPDVRSAAAIALGEMHSTASIAKLEKALSDKDVSVALAAGRSLLLLKNESGYDIYYAVLTGKRKTGESLMTQELNQLDTPKKAAEFAFDQGVGFVPYAGYGIDVINALTKNRDGSPVRAAAARALASDPDPRSGQALVRACSDKNWIVRAAALQAIAERGNPSLAPQIKLEMSDSDDIVRYTAAAAVLRLTWIGQTDKNKQR